MDAIQKASQTWGGKRNPGALNGKSKKKKKVIIIVIIIIIIIVTWVIDAPGAWFAPGWCTTRASAKTVIEETIIITLIIALYFMNNGTVDFDISSFNIAPILYLQLQNCGL